MTRRKQCQTAAKLVRREVEQAYDGYLTGVLHNNCQQQNNTKMLTNKLAMTVITILL
jgi:hypothetical protein